VVSYSNILRFIGDFGSVVNLIYVSSNKLVLHHKIAVTSDACVSSFEIFKVFEAYQHQPIKDKQALWHFKESNIAEAVILFLQKCWYWSRCQLKVSFRIGLTKMPDMKLQDMSNIVTLTGHKNDDRHGKSAMVNMSNLFCRIIRMTTFD